MARSSSASTSMLPVSITSAAAAPAVAGSDVQTRRELPGSNSMRMARCAPPLPAAVAAALVPAGTDASESSALFPSPLCTQ